MAFQTIPCTQRAQPLVNPGDPPTLLFNNDLTHTVYIGDNLGITGGSAETGQIPPLGYVQVDGKELEGTLWGVTLPGQSAQLLVMPGCANAQASPAQIAAQISALGLATATNQTTQIGHENSIDNSTFAASNFLGGVNPGALTATVGKSIAQDMLHDNSGTTTEISALIATGTKNGAPGGAPPLAFPQLLDTLTNTNIPVAGLSRSLVGLNQPSYEGILNVQSANAATDEVLHVTFTWSVATVIIDQEDFFLFIPGGTSGVSNIAFRGPSKAGQLQVTFQTLSLTGQAQVNFYAIYQTSRLFTETTWEQQTWTGTLHSGPAATPTGILGANLAGSVHVLGAFGATINNGVTQTSVLPFWPGKITLAANTGSNTTDLQITLTGAASGALAFNQKSSATGFIGAQDIYLGYEQYKLGVRNTNAAPQTINYYIVASADSN